MPYATKSAILFALLAPFSAAAQTSDCPAGTSRDASGSCVVEAQAACPPDAMVDANGHCIDAAPAATAPAPEHPPAPTPAAEAAPSAAPAPAIEAAPVAAPPAAVAEPTPTPPPSTEAAAPIAAQAKEPSLENAGSPRESAEAVSGFHWVAGGKCPEGEHALKENDALVINEHGALGCVPKGHRPFLKGELSNLGSTKLLLKDSRFGIAIGPQLFGSDLMSIIRPNKDDTQNGLFAHVEPQLDLNFDQLAIGVSAPLNFRAYPGGISAKPAVYTLRQEDWPTPASYARVVNYITYGRKEDHFFLNISQFSPATIGHGTIVRRYFGNTNINDTHVGAEVDAYNRYFGFQFFTRDIVPFTLAYDAKDLQDGHFPSNAKGSAVFQPPLLAGLIFVRPFGGSDSLYLRDLSLGVTYAADLAAPRTLKVDGTGDPIIQPNDTLRVDVAQSTRIVGTDVEFKLYRSDRVDLKPYADFSTISGAGGGATLGLLGRFNFGEETVHALRAVLEVRSFDGQYLPGYFDTLYEIEKYQVIQAKSGLSPTKLAFIMNGDPKARFAQMAAELSYSMGGGFSTTIAYEDAMSTLIGVGSLDPTRVLRNMTVHIEYPVYSFFQFFFTISRRAFDWQNLTAVDNRTTLYSQIRLHLLPILFLNVGLYRTYTIDRVVGTFVNSYGGNVSLEVGYEFDRRKKTEE